MEFELTTELADQIIFAMENQHEDYFLDTEELELVPAEDIDEDLLADEAGSSVGASERFLPIPDWTPSDGFRLMERFVEHLRNPVYRKKLGEALSAGRGVFRRFKDTVKERPEIERAWHAFKDNAMRHEVSEWYNDLRETWGLERIAIEPAETEDLVLSDFTVSRIDAEDTRAAEYLVELAAAQAEETGSPVAFERPQPGRGVGFSAEAPEGDVVAAAWAAVDRGGEGPADGRLGDGRRLAVRVLYVRPAFRGLGLGRLLLERLVEVARAEGWTVVTMELSGRALVLDETAQAFGFETVAKRVELDLGRGAQ